MSLADDDLRLDDGYRLPYPIIHPVDIETEQINRPSRSGLSDQIVDMLGGDPGLGKTWGMEEGVLVSRKKRSTYSYVSLVPVKQMPPPAVIDDEIGGIAFAAVAGTNFDARPVDGRNQRKDVEQNPIFFKFGVLPEADVRESG